MAKKIGDIAIGLAWLVFGISAFSFIFVSLDDSEGVTSELSSDLNEFTGELREVTNMQNQYYQKVDNSTDLAFNPDSDNENRASDTSGILNLFSKNVLVRFIRLSARTFTIPTPITILVSALMGLTITILVVRFFWGENKA